MEGIQRYQQEIMAEIRHPDQVPVTVQLPHQHLQVAMVLHQL